nr:hypothetical protein [Tanacetum cinerariifolium]
MLIVVPFLNLELGDSDDPPLGVYIESRFPVNNEPVELLTFSPPVRNSPKGVLVIVYRLLLPPNDIQALSGCYMTPSSIHRVLQSERCTGSSAKADSLADACRDLD